MDSTEKRGREGEEGGGEREMLSWKITCTERERETVGSGNMASASVRRQMGFILFSNFKHFDENKTLFYKQGMSIIL